MKTVALVPIRSGSKEIPDKNIKDMCGKPLACWVIDAAVKSTVDSVWVSSDSREYLDLICSRYSDKVFPFHRPAELATDDIHLDPTILNFAEKIQFDAVITLQATNPFTETTDINGALNRIEAYDSMLSAVRHYRFAWTASGEAYSNYGKPVNYDYLKRPNRQSHMEPFHIENGAFYITKRDTLFKYKNRLGGNIGIYNMPKHTLTEIDSEEDWKAVEKTLAYLVS